MNESKKEVLSYIDTVSLIFLSALLLIFPLLFTTAMTDFFTLPKQVLVIGVGTLLFVLYAVRNVIIGKVVFRSTPFNLPILLFLLVVTISSLLSANRFDALSNLVPLLFSILLFYLIVNIAKKPNSLLILISSLVVGACLVSVLSLLYYFKIYVLPFSETFFQAFTPLGSALDQAIYLALILPVAGYIAWPIVAPYLIEDRSNVPERRVGPLQIAFLAAFLLIAAGLSMTVYTLMTMQKPIILPFDTGFQTAFAAISQDSGRIFLSFLFGTGYGTYLTVFTRFKQAAYNLNPEFWSFTFFRSSSFLLELLATTGVLGTASFFFIIYRFVRQKSFFLPLILAIAAALLLPFSAILVTLFFVLLSIFAAASALEHQRRYPDLEFSFVAAKRGNFMTMAEPGHEVRAGHDLILPIITLLLILISLGVSGFFIVQYVRSDMKLRTSVVAAANNDGLGTYNNQRDAIALFPWRDTNYRLFSQTNLALANSLAVSQPKDKQPNQEVQQNILTLIQQSINSGRSAVTLSPQTALNWNNLSSIYRALIGFGQNADQFAILTNNQAIALDPKNPQQFINLGGIYYQLSQWEQAQAQFQQAISLKQDYANAWYNLGHALESKGDLENALRSYQTVKTLVAGNAENTKKISDEIEALEKKIGSSKESASDVELENGQDQTPLGINSPERQLPERKPPVEIPGPTVTVTPKASPTPKVPPAGGPSPTKTSQPTPQL